MHAISTLSSTVTEKARQSEMGISPVNLDDLPSLSHNTTGGNNNCVSGNEVRVIVIIVFPEAKEASYCCKNSDLMGTCSDSHGIILTAVMPPILGLCCCCISDAASHASRD